MPTVVTVHVAKTHLSKLLERVAAGEEVIIARGETPVARLVPLGRAGKPRRPGLLKGRIRIAADFDAPLPSEVLAAFYGGTDPSSK